MADIDNAATSKTPWLAILLGALILFVATLGYYVYTHGQFEPTTAKVNVNTPSPQTPIIPQPH
jgi:hypothetical protein